MAKECLQQPGGCWRIQPVVETMIDENLDAGSREFHPYEDAPSFLLQICAATYDCPGPGQASVPIEAGSAETQLVPTCNYPGGADFTEDYANRGIV